MDVTSARLSNITSNFSLKSTAFRGVLWTVAAFGSQQVLRFASNLILTRVLLPEFFGLMALVNSLRIGLELFSDVGIGQNIIQSPRGEDPRYLNTAWIIQIIRGILLWLACWAVAKPIADFYDTPLLTTLIPVVCLTMVFSGLSSTKFHLLSRKMTLGKLTAFELSKQVVGLAVIVTWAVIYPSVWALAGGAIASAIYKVIASHWFIPGKSNRLDWDSTAAKEIVSFGKWIFLASIMTFLAEQSDRFLIGKLLSLETLGVFTIAFMLAQMPKQVLKRIGHKIIFPLVSRKATLPREQLKNIFLSKRKFLLAGVVLLLAVLVGGGDLLVSFLYDDRYKDASWAMPILCLGGWFSALYYSSSPCLLGIGKPHYNAQSNFSRFLSIVIGIPLGFHLFGAVGAIAAIGISDLPTYATVQRGLWKEQISTLKQDALFSLAFVCLLGLIFMGRTALGIPLPLRI